MTNLSSRSYEYVILGLISTKRLTSSVWLTARLMSQNLILEGFPQGWGRTRFGDRGKNYNAADVSGCGAK